MVEEPANDGGQQQSAEGETLSADSISPAWIAESLADHRREMRSGRSIDDLARAALTASDTELLRDAAFLVLRPDALASGSGTVLLRHLQKHFGASVMGMAVQQISASRFNALYRHELHLMGHLVWLHHALFRSGPVAAVLLRGERGAHASFSERLTAAKGDASPAFTGDGGLRTVMGRMSAVHVGFHCSDDVGALLCESLLFFEMPQLVSALRRREPVPEERWATLLELEPPANATVYQAIVQFKLRVLTALAVAGDSIAGHLEHLERMTLQAGRRLSELSYEDQRLAFREFARREHRPLRAAIESAQKAAGDQVNEVLATPGVPYDGRLAAVRSVHDRLGAMYATWYLSGHEACTVDDGGPLLDAAARIGVHCSDRLRTLLLTGLQYDVNPRATWSGARLYDNDWMSGGDGD